MGNKQYIMFENAGVADFFALFLVGFTDKRNDPKSIGMFGSGFKLAITAALRFGIEIILYMDRDRVTFHTVDRVVNGTNVKQLMFTREQQDGKKEEHATNLTLGYGEMDWKQEWCVYREMLANCRDADPGGYQVVMGVEPKPREGFTRAFVEATNDLMEIYRNSDRFFKEERHSIFSSDLGRIYPKASPENETYFYCKGMFVLATPDTSLYDLDLFQLPINESRDASAANLLTHVLQLYDQAPPDIKEEVLKFAIEGGEAGGHTLEGNLYWYRSQRPQAWVEAFRRAFPDHVLCSFSDIEYRSMVLMGRKAVRATNSLYRMLSANGVLTAERLLRDEQQTRREVFKPRGILAQHYQQAFDEVSQALPEVNRLNIDFVRLPPRERTVGFVTCSRAQGEYQFSERLLKQGPKAIATSLVDALAQTKSLNGRCHVDYENSLLSLVLDAASN